MRLRVNCALFWSISFSFYYRKAGGKTTNGKNHSLLELDFDEIHATTPCFLAQNMRISELLKAYNEWNKRWVWARLR